MDAVGVVGVVGPGDAERVVDGGVKTIPQGRTPPECVPSKHGKTAAGCVKSVSLPRLVVAAAAAAVHLLVAAAAAAAVHLLVAAVAAVHLLTAGAAFSCCETDASSSPSLACTVTPRYLYPGNVSNDVKSSQTAASEKWSI